jgi:hypothetical protein
MIRGGFLSAEDRARDGSAASRLTRDNFRVNSPKNFRVMT